MKLLIASHACATPVNQEIFALAARRHDWEVTFVLPQSWLNEYGNRLEARALEGFAAKVIALPVMRNGSVPLHAYRGRLGRLLKREQPDVVYAHNEAYALSTAQWCGANAMTIDRPFGFFSCQNLLKRYPPPFRWAESWVYRRSSFFFPITEAVDRVHREKGYKGRSMVLPLGFDPLRYRATEPPGNRAARAEGRTFRFAYVGRVVEEKGLLTLARALGSLRDRDWSLTMVGAGPYESTVRAAFEEAGVGGRVAWRGFVPHEETAGFFESMDALVIPSETRPNWKEQFGRVILEALACGTPVVGSDSGEIPNLIRRTGGGRVFAEANPEACATALREMMEDHVGRARMAENGHRNAHADFSLPALAERFADEIHESVQHASVGRSKGR